MKKKQIDLTKDEYIFIYESITDYIDRLYGFGLNPDELNKKYEFGNALTEKIDILIRNVK